MHKGTKVSKDRFGKSKQIMMETQTKRLKCAKLISFVQNEDKLF